MKYSVSNTINAPLSTIAEKFKEPEGAIEWMEGLHKIEHISGTPLDVGARSNFHFTHKGKEMVMEETVLEQNLPNQVKFSYGGEMGHSEVEIIFEEQADGTVKQINNSFFDLKGFMKVMGFFFKGMFKKQSLKYMDGFKAYAEK